MELKDLPIAALKYFPIERDQNAFLIPDGQDADSELGSDGLPIPPPSLLRGYADSAENYIWAGEINTRGMLKVLADSSIELAVGTRILDFGCGIARMTRQLASFAETGEVWGVDISARHIFWCKRHLSPPFRFVTTTTIPHLPFRDGYFGFVFAGSVFTHIDDLADAWLCEVRRVLAPGGCAYLTVHDESTVELLRGPYSEHWLKRQLHENSLFKQNEGRFGMLAIDRAAGLQVFYSRAFFLHMLAQAFDIVAVVPHAHGYQTAYIVRPRP